MKRGIGYSRYEVYDYQVTQYNPETGEGGLFVELINNFLKLKLEACVISARSTVPKTRIDMWKRFGRVK